MLSGQTETILRVETEKLEVLKGIQQQAVVLAPGLRFQSGMKRKHKDERVMMKQNELADKLMKLGARRSVETQFGWTHPDCQVLSEAARIIRGEPEKIDLPPDVVLSVNK